MTGATNSAPRPKTTTRQTLERLRNGLIVLNVLVLGLSFYAFQSISRTADAVHDRTAAAILEVTAARAALVDADSAADTSFQSGEVTLAGPGERYQSEIAAAGQSLARVAEFNEAGDSGSRVLQVVEGLVAAYTGSIGEADTHYRQDRGAVLGAAELWYASRLLHQPGGVLTQLDSLRDAQRKALDHRLSSGWMNRATLAAWIAPMALLLALLVLTQWYVRRKFRRSVSWPLAVATLLLGVLAAGMAFSVVSQQRLDSARVSLNGVLGQWQSQMSATDAAGQRRLDQVLTAHCSLGSTCGDSVERFVADLPAAPADTGVRAGAAINDGVRRVNEQTARASDTEGVELVMVFAALGLVVLVPYGLQPRIDEYRYRSPDEKPTDGAARDSRADLLLRLWHRLSRERQRAGVMDGR